MVKILAELSLLVLVEFVGITHGAVNVAGIKAHADERQHSAQRILILVEGVMGRPEKTHVHGQGDQGIFITVAVELSRARYDAEETPTMGEI